jgi:tetratricopeptide (TPR) repeat protein
VLKDAGACYNRGSVYNRSFDRDWAISDFDQAIRLNPNYDQVYNNRGNAYDNKGDYDRAISDANEAIRARSASGLRCGVNWMASRSRSGDGPHRHAVTAADDNARPRRHAGTDLCLRDCRSVTVQIVENRRGLDHAGRPVLFKTEPRHRRTNPTIRKMTDW